METTLKKWCNLFIFSFPFFLEIGKTYVGRLSIILYESLQNNLISVGFNQCSEISIKMTHSS